MGALVQIHDVPEEVYRKLESRAAAEGVSLSEYCLRILARSASRPTVEELSARIEARGRVDLGDTIVETVRDIRDHGE